jgi:DNA mismatch endonuclease (patch repair protein)
MTRVAAEQVGTPAPPDPLDRATRSRVMARVRAKNTRPEMMLRRALWGAGLRGWRCHVRNVPGTPDLCWQARKVAVFVDSAWWHGHPSRWVAGRHPPEWDQKIERNIRRDTEVNLILNEMGWTVVRIWDFDLVDDIDVAVDRVKQVIAKHPPVGNKGGLALVLPE